MCIGIIYIVFIPDKIELERSRKALCSISNYSNIICCGFVKDEFKSLFKNILNSFFPDYKLFLSEKNIGKSSIINNNIKHFEKFKYVLIMDHDIILTQSINLKHLIQLIKNFNILVFNQLEDNRHSRTIYENSILSNQYTLLYPTNMYGIAGGSFFCETNLLQKHKWPSVGKYGPDDTFFFRSLSEKNYKIVVIKEMNVIHPFSNNLEYSKWKSKCLSRFF